MNALKTAVVVIGGATVASIYCVTVGVLLARWVVFLMGVKL